MQQQKMLPRSSQDYSINQTSHSQPNNLIEAIFSYNENIMLVAIISLLLVILFVLLLHVYARWFLTQARYRSSTSSVSVPQVLAGSRFHHFHAFTIENNTFFSTPTKGLEASLISSIPLFVFREDDELKHGSLLECVICLSVFEDEDIGRKLPKCGHAFHVECIDMWLHSHTTCPICRAPAAENMIVDVKNHELMILTNEVAVGSTESRSVELGVGNGDYTSEITIEVSSLENIENLSSNGSQSECSSSSLGGSLRRMLSKNRSERKIQPSTCVNDLDV